MQTAPALLRRGRSAGVTVIALLVGGLVAAAHAPVLDSQALALDDNVFVAHNPLVQRPGWESVGRFFGEVFSPSTVSAYYTPLSMTSLMLDYAMGGRPRDLRVFHLTSLALHAINAVLVLLLLERMLGSLLPAALAALLFGLHPLTVEPVVSVGERKTLLAACFGFSCMLAHLQYVRAGRLRWKLLAVVLFGLALLSKPSVTALPLLLLLLDYWPLHRWSWAAAREKWPYVALAAGFSAITVLAIAETWEFGTLPPLDLPKTVLQICYLLGFYLGKIAWPTDLSSVYVPPAAYTLSHPAVAIGIATTVALAILMALLWRRSPGALVGCGVFLLALAPTFGILRWSWLIAYDRYVYFPAMGLSLVVGVALAAAWRSRPLSGLVPRALLLALVLAAAVAETRGVRAALLPWKDSLSYWRHVVALAPETPEAHNGLGAALSAHYAPLEAVAEFRRAVEVGPGYSDSRLNLGSVLINLGRAGEAIPHLEWVAERRPRNQEVAWALGLAYRDAGRLDDAAAQFRRALQLRPDFTLARVQTGIVELLQGRSSEGIETLRGAVRLAPKDAYPRLGLAMGLLRVRGADAEVLGLLRQAIELEPDWAVPSTSWHGCCPRFPIPRSGIPARRCASPPAPSISPTDGTRASWTPRGRRWPRRGDSRRPSNAGGQRSPSPSGPTTIRWPRRYASGSRNTGAACPTSRPFPVVLPATAPSPPEGRLRRKVRHLGDALVQTH